MSMLLSLYSKTCSLRTLCLTDTFHWWPIFKMIHYSMYIPLSDDKHQMVRDSSKKRTGQRGRNSNPVATLPHAAVVFRVQPFNYTPTPLLGTLAFCGQIAN